MMMDYFLHCVAIFAVTSYALPLHYYLHRVRTYMKEMLSDAEKGKYYNKIITEYINVIFLKKFCTNFFLQVDIVVSYSFAEFEVF